MFCPQCGTARSATSRFCATCGHPFEPTGASTGTGRRIAVIGGCLVAVVALTAGAAVVFNSRSTKDAPTVRGSRVGAVGSSSPASPAAASPATFSALYKQDAAGVIRIETTACDGGGVGSGFLVAPDLIATVAHVVQGAVSVVLRQGIDPARELALVRSSVPLTGHVFTLTDAQPDVGIDVAAIGYPLAGPESFSKGTVSGLNRPVRTETASLTGLIQTDTPINFGNSGGPLLTADGTVVGLVEAKNTDAANIGFAIPAATAGSQIAAWQQSPVPVHDTRQCGSPTGPSGVTASVTDSSGSTDGPALAQAFETYATGINTGDYSSAYAVLSPRAQSLTSPDQFAQGDASSYLVTLDITSVTPAASGSDTVVVRFTSVQDPALGGRGQSCSDWQMTYTMIDSATGWLIDRAAPHAGSPAAC
jgi:serine protease Do